MSQRLKAAQDILTSLEKDRELSFKEFSKILVKQKINSDSFNKVKARYEGIDELMKGVTIFTSLGNVDKDYLFKKNLYKTPRGWFEKLLYNWRWNGIIKGDFYTIFKITNGQEFIYSLLRYVDNLKHDGGDILGTTVQRRKITEILERKREEFGKESFTFEISINKYFNDRVEYYRVITETDKLSVTNIKVFGGKIYFFIEMTDSEPIKDREIIWEEKGGFLHMHFGGREKKFKKGRNTYHIVKESLSRETNEMIDFIEMVDKVSGKKDQDEMKMIYNAINYANNEIESELKIGGFFGVEEKAYRRQLDVIEL